jgi:hypothetical protein
MRLQCQAAYSTEDGGTGETPEGSGQNPTIIRYTLKLETGKRSAPDNNENTWGALWVKVIDMAGSEKELFFKDSVNSGGLGSEGVPGYSLEGTKVLDIISGDAIGLLPKDISKVKVEWVESNGADAWAFKGIGISYQLSNNQTGVLKINGEDYYSQEPYIQHFRASGHTHQSWPGLAMAVTKALEGTEGEEHGPPIPKPVISKADDECCQTMLLAHLNANTGYYNRAIWFLQDPVEDVFCLGLLCRAFHMFLMVLMIFH